VVHEPSQPSAAPLAPGDEPVTPDVAGGADGDAGTPGAPGGRGTVFHDLPPAVAGGGQVDAGAPSAARRGARWVIEWAFVILIAVGVAYGMRQYVVGTYYIPSQSMEPTLMVGDRILVNKLAYHLHDIHRGDIVVFGRPPGETAATDIKDLVKRVVGLPGETISSAPNGQVLVNGRPISEPWLTANARANPGPAIVRQTIPPGEYFVMGDNRGDSEDSRFFGPIPGSIVVGHVVLRFWPLSQIHVF